MNICSNIIITFIDFTAVELIFFFQVHGLTCDKEKIVWQSRMGDATVCQGILTDQSRVELLSMALEEFPSVSCVAAKHENPITLS